MSAVPAAEEAARRGGCSTGETQPHDAHTAGSHCRSSSTSCRNSGGRLEPHWLSPAARATSAAPTAAFSCAASVGRATARARCSATRQSSIEPGLDVTLRGACGLAGCRGIDLNPWLGVYCFTGCTAGAVGRVLVRGGGTAHTCTCEGGALEGGEVYWRQTRCRLTLSFQSPTGGARMAEHVRPRARAV